MPIIANSEFGQVHRVSTTEDIDVIEIKHQHCQAKLSLYGGQVLSWIPQGQKDIFWLSDTAAFEQGKAIRGGIPLCWPWFGRHFDDADNKFGNHGFARDNQWDIEDVVIDKDCVTITLVFQSENKHNLWPNAFNLSQTLSFGSTFKQSLTMINLGNDNALYTGALHSYFRVSSPKNTTVAKLSNAPFDDKLTAESYPPQPLLNGVGPIDRVYHSSENMQIDDSQWRRVIEVNASNTEQWVFWNPGVELANNMSDIHPNGEQEFICLEAANTNAKILVPGQKQSISQVINVIPYE